MVSIFEKFIERLQLIFNFNRENSPVQKINIKKVGGKVEAKNVINKGDKNAPRKR